MAKTQKVSQEVLAAKIIAGLRADLITAHRETEAAEEKLRHSLAREGNTQGRLDSVSDSLKEANDSLEETRKNLRIAGLAVNRLDAELERTRVRSEGKEGGIIEGCKAMLGEFLDQADF